jgi:uncharacterized membrane protein YkvA (DUF1232 family)
VRWLLFALGAVLVVWLIAIALLVWRGRASLARELVTFVPNVLRLFRGLLGDPRVPRSAKAWLVVGIVWLASPIDLIPEFLPGVGPLDDAMVAALVLRHLVRRAGTDVVREHWHGDPRTLGVVLRVAGRSSG